ncbi:DUF309 domain-containing protein [Paenibacillus albiflavus]|uniref:DUF309 domain-containing protein n=1 Tax=Paenibacillus albiflavus TaxID=2545760 RepID=A0A4V2WN66_9BACL|nr:DUF309 domain-containing protein [Paenibacillus albiflavus]TCZ74282.1 DUF309 domain-containing protein [Paenibacillus albiflavus]
MSQKIYDPLYLQFLYDFNCTRDYFECHESLEELWLEEAKDPFYQGLLQVAVALYHHRNENVSGALKLMRSALDKLSRYPERMLGIDLEQVRINSRAYLTKLEHIPNVQFEHEPFDIVILDPALQEQLNHHIHELERKITD